MDPSNVNDPPDIKNPQGKSKISKKTEPKLPFNFACSMEKIEAEQVKASARLDKCYPVVEDSKPLGTGTSVGSKQSKEAEPSDNKEVALASEPSSPVSGHPIEIPPKSTPSGVEASEVLTFEKPTASEKLAPSGTPQPTHPSEVALEPKPMKVSNKSGVVPSANPMPPSPARVPPARRRFYSSSSSSSEEELTGAEHCALIAEKIRESVRKVQEAFPQERASVKHSQNWRTPHSQAHGAPSPAVLTKSMPQSSKPRESLEKPTTSAGGKQDSSSDSEDSSQKGLQQNIVVQPSKAGTMQEELLCLTNQELLLYKETIQKLSANHSTSLAPYPVDQKSTGSLEVVQKYGIEESIRFEAMTTVWSARGFPSANQDEDCNSTPFVETVSGHYGLYQVQEFHGKCWRATAWYPTSLREVFVSDDSKLIGSKLSALSTIIVGDVLAVKELLNGAVLKCHILMRRIEQKQTTKLKNDCYGIKGYGRAVRFETDQTNVHYLKEVSVYVPIQCSPETPHVLKIKNMTWEKMCENPWSKMWLHFREGHLAFTPEAADHLAVLGSSLYSALQYGNFDEQVYQGSAFQQISHGVIQFTARLDDTKIKSWSPGVHFSIVCTGQWFLELMEIKHIKSPTNRPHKHYYFVTGKLLHGDSVALCTNTNRLVLRQVGVRFDRPLLEAGFFQKMDEKSNGRRIISAIFGSREKWEEPKEKEQAFKLGEGMEVCFSTRTYSKNQMMEIRKNKTELHGKLPALIQRPKEREQEDTKTLTMAIRHNGMELVCPQSEYIARLLSNAPITVGRFPISSGKTSTVAMAALKLAQRDPKSTNLVLTPDVKRSKRMLAKIKELNNSDMSSDVKEVRMCSDFDLEQFLVDIYAGKFPSSKSLREKIEKSLENLENADFDYWLHLYYELDPPQILILDCQEFWRFSKHLKIVKNVYSIQFEDMHEIPQMELIQIATVFPHAIFGLMMDRTAPSLEFETFCSYQNSLVCGELDKKAEQFFPVVQSKNVYNVPADVVNLIRRRFGGVNEAWIDPHVQRKIEDYPIQTWCIDSPTEYVEVMKRVLDDATVAPEEIGVFCSTYKQMSDAEKCSALREGVMVGCADDFRGVQKRVMIILADVNSKIIQNEITFVLTRGSEKTHVVHLRDKLETNQDWKALLKNVVEDKKVIAQWAYHHRHLMRPHRRK